jgi:hypothetical protein
MRHAKIPHRRKRRSAPYHQVAWGRVFFWLIALSFFGGLLYVLLMLPMARIAHIDVHGTNRIDATAVTQLVEHHIDGLLWSRISNRQYVMVHTRVIAQSIRSQFGAVADVTVRKVFPDTIVVEIAEWDHVYLWCTNDEQQCRVLYSNGMLGDVALSDSRLVQENSVTRIVDQGTQEINASEQVVSSEDFAVMRALPERLAAIDVHMRTDRITAPARIAHTVIIETENIGQLLISLEQPLDHTIQTLDAILTHEIPEDRRDHVMYIDLRVAGKVFYQFNDELPTEDHSKEVSTENETVLQIEEQQTEEN